MPWLLVIEHSQKCEGSINAGQGKENSKRLERRQSGRDGAPDSLLVAGGA